MEAAIVTSTDIAVWSIERHSSYSPSLPLSLSPSSPLMSRPVGEAKKGGGVGGVSAAREGFLPFLSHEGTRHPGTVRNERKPLYHWRVMATRREPF